MPTLLVLGLIACTPPPPPSLAEAARDATARCAALTVDGHSADEAATGLWFDAAALEAACGELAGLWDAHAATHRGQDRTTDSLLYALARAGDEVDFVRRALAADLPDRRRVAWQHLRDGLADVDKDAHRLAQAPPDPYTAAAGDEAWARQVAQDASGVGKLHDHLDRRAFQQFLDPARVRRRMLLAAFVPVRAGLAARRAALADPALDARGDERTARAAYLDTADATVASLRAIAEAYLAGVVTTEALRDHHMAEAARVQAHWTATWTAERSRVGTPR